MYERQPHGPSRPAGFLRDVMLYGKVPVVPESKKVEDQGDSIYAYIQVLQPFGSVHWLHPALSSSALEKLAQNHTSIPVGVHGREGSPRPRPRPAPSSTRANCQRAAPHGRKRATPLGTVFLNVLRI